MPIVVTPGEPAGIGPDLCLLLAEQGLAADFIVIADPQLLEARAKALGLAIRLAHADAAPDPHTLRIEPVALATPARARQLDPANAPYVLEALRLAVQGCLAGRYTALVTGPVHKGIINTAGIAFFGHTEYLAALTHTAQAVMMLTIPNLRVVLVTTHLPLAEVSRHITHERLTQVVRITATALTRQFGIPAPRLLVCGLNPHAGEGGHLGREEIEVITPALEALRAEGLRLEGPVPADTAFTPPMLARCDAILAMYHDQGLTVLKHAGFRQAVNITLGLPIIRTSVDHGTALDRAGTGRVDTGSLRAALSRATSLTRDH